MASAEDYTSVQERHLNTVDSGYDLAEAAEVPPVMFHLWCVYNLLETSSVMESLAPLFCTCEVSRGVSLTNHPFVVLLFVCSCALPWFTRHSMANTEWCKEPRGSGTTLVSRGPVSSPHQQRISTQW
ncbi:hypothetical protein E2C01_001145 [Portunus trituberculatus]|uniref:Uncharacterized protein n=1 Tax=Portunus trituberculatus TaxID=210409 RepID=A0A5B7CH21_PORTR|nr:hypothetical protein [Portunus trituberculatus]